MNKSVGYGYTNADLTAIVTPSGQSVTYGYNSNHQVTSISVNSTTVLSSVIYEPFGGVNGWSWGNGTTVSRSFNGDGLISQIVSASTTLGYSFDNANRITGISDSSNSALTWTYGYDSLDRLTSAATSAITDGWTYDANGNRLTQTGTTPITFTVSPTSNQLNATSGSLVRTYAYDAAGNTQTTGAVGLTYNNRGRVANAAGGSVSYLYNALGQMIEKSGTLGTTILMQDEAGHLIGEYDGSGNLVQETVWLGDIPVATLRSNGSGGVNIFYVHTDHLNTPRKVSRPSDNQLEWRWDTDPFGTAAANQNPVGLGTFAYNLRFPGQMYQTETGLNQNYFRDYDPAVGRYVESDPIGIEGGVNTYAVLLNNPVWNIDPNGQDVTVAYFPGTNGHVGIAVNSSSTVGLYPRQRGINVLLCRDVAGAVNNDRAKHDAATNRDAKYLTIHTSATQDQLIQNYIDSVRNNPNRTYNLCSNQCTSFVRNALRAGGVPIPADGTEGIIPGDLFFSLRDAYGSQASNSK